MRTNINIKSYILVSSVIIMARILTLFSSFGIEHDSGWYLGVAKNIALRGTYTSYTNTIVEESLGPHPSIHNRFSVQDQQGYSYFPAGVTVGPGYVVPQAVFLKIFGDGWVQYRIWPMVSIFFLILLLFYVVWSLGGLLALVIFQIWIWLFPQLYVSFAYESFSESIALLFLLTSFYFWQRTRYSKTPKLQTILAGSFSSFAVLTKSLSILGVFAFAPIFATEKLSNKTKLLGKGGGSKLFFVLAFILPIGLFEIYRYLYLVTTFGTEAYLAINRDIALTFSSGGSGIGTIFKDGFISYFIVKKIFVWSNLGLEQLSFLTLPLILIGSMLVFPKIKLKNRILYLLIFFATFFFFSWFILLSSTGWPRHVWQGLVLGMMLLTIIFGNFVKQFEAKIKLENLMSAIFAVVFVSSMTSRYTTHKFMLKVDDLNRLREMQTYNGLQGLPNNAIFNKIDQENLKNYFSKNIKRDDRIYYHGWFLVAEVPPLVDKVFFPLERYFKNPDRQNTSAYLIIGPYQKGKHSLVDPNYYTSLVNQYCKKIVFENSSYSLCLLKDVNDISPTPN